MYHGGDGSLDAVPAWTAESNQAYAYFGFAVSSAGDVNGDGYADLIVAANQYANGETGEGRAFVFHGSAAGLGPLPAWTAESNQAQANFGSAVSSAGDVNGDGYDDVVVGADMYDGAGADEGRASVYHGSSAGLGPAIAVDTARRPSKYGAQAVRSGLRIVHKESSCGRGGLCRSLQG